MAGLTKRTTVYVISMICVSRRWINDKTIGDKLSFVDKVDIHAVDTFIHQLFVAMTLRD